MNIEAHATVMNLSVDQALKRAKLHSQKNEFSEARGLYEAVLKVFPGNVNAQQGLKSLCKKNVVPDDKVRMQNKINDLINLYNADGFSEVIDEARLLAEQYPNSYIIWNVMGAAAAQIDMLDLSIMALRQVIALKPDHAIAYNNLGNTFIKLDNYSDAIEAFKNAIKIQPDNLDALYNMSIALRLQGDFDEAMEACGRVVRMQPQNAKAHHTMGKILQDLGKPEEATKAYMKAIEIKPDYAGALNSLSRCYLMQNDFVKAFEHTEWRWLAQQDNIGSQFKSNKPSWTGEQHEKVFVWKEQGIGDELMLSSMFVDLIKKSENIVIECDSRLIPLYERSFPKNIQFINDRNQISEGDYDSQIAIGSLPKYLRHELNDFKSVASGWLSADGEKVNVLREKLRSESAGKIIGISWLTMAALEKAQHRNIALPKLAEYLTQIPGKYVSLQYGDVAEEVDRVSYQTGINISRIEEIDNFRDIDGLAALISACDLVISIDNLTVHLAGSLGVDTRVILPKVADARWGTSTRASYWYDSVTLYRQEDLGDWCAPLNHLVNDLTA